jgi:(2Fe-2S) ferredoxin
MGKTVLVCTNVDCHDRGSEDVLNRLLDRLDESDLECEVRDYLCFSACEKGPNVVVVEDRVWYTAVEGEDAADEIFDKHLTDGQVVEEYTQDSDNITKNLIFTVLDAGIMPGSV